LSSERSQQHLGVKVLADFIDQLDVLAERQRGVEGENRTGVPSGVVDEGPLAASRRAAVSTA